MGLPELQILVRESVIENNDPFAPLKHETVFLRSDIEMYKPTWSYNKVRINRFSDTWNIWVPFPNNNRDETFLNFVHSKENLRPSLYRDYTRAKTLEDEYIFTSFSIYLDEDVRII